MTGTTPETSSVVEKHHRTMHVLVYHGIPAHFVPQDGLREDGYDTFVLLADGKKVLGKDGTAQRVALDWPSDAIRDAVLHAFAADQADPTGATAGDYIIDFTRNGGTIQ